MPLPTGLALGGGTRLADPLGGLATKLRTLALVAVALLVTAQTTTMVLRGSRLPLAAFGALAVIAVALTWQRAVLWAVLAFSCFVVNPNLGYVQVFGVTTDIGQALGYAVIAWALLGLTTGRRSWQGRLRFASPLLLLVGSAAVGAVLGLTGGASQFLVLGQFKEYLLYLIVIPLMLVVRTRQQRQQLQTSVLWLCTLGSAWVCLAGLTGGRLPVYSPGAAIVETLGKTVDAQRIRPAMLPLLVVASLLLAVQVGGRGWTRLRALQAGLFTGAWVLTLTRSFWLPLVLALLLVPVLKAGRRIPLRGLRNGLVMVVVCGGAFTAAASGALGPTAAAAADRVYSIGSPELANDPSYTDRAEELTNALQTLRQHPLTGVGLGQPYGAKRPVYDARANTVRYEDRFFTHNSLLLAYLQGGLLAVLSFLLLVAIAVRVAIRARRGSDPVDDNLRVAGALSVVTLVAVSLVNTHLIYRPNAVALCVAVALMAPPVRDA